MQPEPWDKSPVLHLDLSGADYHSGAVLESKLNFFLAKFEEEYGIKREGDFLSVSVSQPPPTPSTPASSTDKA